ncbi:MAG: hypothetical protein KA354_16315 [Phycisphaerae bacterium]|nr:hypothetical protein [Phycisphaerae bacterium]
MKLFSRIQRLAMMAAMGCVFASGGCLPAHAWAELGNNVVNQVVAALVAFGLAQAGL